MTLFPHFSRVSIEILGTNSKFEGNFEIELNSYDAQLDAKTEIETTKRVTKLYGCVY